MENPINQRVIAFIRHLGISENKFSIQIACGQTTLNAALHSAKGVPTNILIAILNRYPELSAEWLMRGVGDMTNSMSGNSATQEIRGGNNEGATFTNSVGCGVSNENENIVALLEQNRKLTERVIQLTEMIVNLK